jgi:GTP-dependent phosphoenolpyruvate carboxykinase
MEPLEALNQLRTILFDLNGTSVEEAMIVKEHHFTNSVGHLHVYIKISKKLERRDPLVFDLNYIDKVYHGNYQSVTNIKRVLNYLVKQASPENAYCTAKIFKRVRGREFLGIDRYLIELAEEGKFKEAILI